MSFNSNVSDDGGVVSAQVQFPLQLDDSGLTLESSAAPVSAEVEDQEEDSSSSAAFTPSISIPKLKKYYSKLERRICIWVLLSQIFFLGSFFVGVNAIVQAWASSSILTHALSWINSIASSPYAKGGVTGVTACLMFLCYKNIHRLQAKKKSIIHEANLCKMMYYPSCMTPASTENVLSIFKWRMNIFWLGFASIGLAVNLLTVANGWYLYQNYSTQSADFYWNKFQKFTNMFELLKKWETGVIPDRLVDIAFWLLNSGVLSMIFTRFPFKILINKALGTFNLNEMNMGADLREHVFKINKRNKIYTLVLLCITGLPTFIILKRLIIAVFNKSFKYSKR